MIHAQGELQASRHLAEAAAQLAETAVDLACRSIAFTYNDPIIFLEYALDVAAACRERDIRTVAVTAGYIDPEPRVEFFQGIDAANVDLKAFTDRFYYKICGGHLAPVLETLEYIKHETDCWLELTTLLIPGENDSEGELNEMTRWVVEELGPEVPMHFTAFHPDWKLRDRPPTPGAPTFASPGIRRATRDSPARLWRPPLQKVRVLICRISGLNWKEIFTPMDS